MFEFNSIFCDCILLIGAVTHKRPAGAYLGRKSKHIEGGIATRGYSPAVRLGQCPCRLVDVRCFIFFKQLAECRLVIHAAPYTTNGTVLCKPFEILPDSRIISNITKIPRRKNSPWPFMSNSIFNLNLYFLFHHCNTRSCHKKYILFVTKQQGKSDLYAEMPAPQAYIIPYKSKSSKNTHNKIR